MMRIVRMSHGVNVSELLGMCEDAAGKDGLWDEIKQKLSTDELKEFLIGYIDDYDLGIEVLDD